MIWRFPEIGLPINHPFLIVFSIINHLWKPIYCSDSYYSSSKGIGPWPGTSGRAPCALRPLGDAAGDAAAADRRATGRTAAGREGGSAGDGPCLAK